MAVTFHCSLKFQYFISAIFLRIDLVLDNSAFGRLTIDYLDVESYLVFNITEDI